VTGMAAEDTTRGPRGRLPTTLARRPLTRWRTVDMVTAPVLGVAFGVVFWGWGLVYDALTPLFTVVSPLQSTTSGIWFIGGVVGALIVRRPGAALFVEALAAFVETVLGGQWGATTLVSGVLQGLGAELVFALFAYRVFSRAVAVAAGSAAALLEITGYEWWSWTAGYSWPWKLAYLASGVVSGALLAGVLGFALVRVLAASGALDRFPPGIEHARRR